MKANLSDSSLCHSNRSSTDKLSCSLLVVGTENVGKTGEYCNKLSIATKSALEMETNFTLK